MIASENIEKIKDMSREKNAIGDIDSYIGYWLRFVSNQVSTAFQKRLLKGGATVAEWFVLRFLYSHAPCTLTKLSEEMSLNKGVVSRLADRLEKRGLIVRKEAQNDRRAFSIELTQAGLKLVPKLARLADENDEHFFADLSASQRNILKQIMQDLVRRHGFKTRPID